MGINMAPSGCLRRAVAHALLAGSAAVVVTMPVMAQDVLLEDIVVTARKRAENIQDVPVAVSAIAGADIENAFTLDTTSLAQFAPNVVFDTIESGTPNGGGFSIRGIAYQDVDKGFDPTVLVAVDEVPIATGTAQVFDLLDIERIEVLRGPQGTLFGKNVVGGLINIHRTKPKLNETSGKVRARAGMFQKYSGDALFNFGAETWAVKLTGGLSKQDKGYLKNPTKGRRVWKRDTENFGVHFLWEPNDIFTGEIQFNYSNDSGEASPAFNLDIDQKDVFCFISGQCSGAPGESSSGARDTVLGEFNGDIKYKKYMAITELNAKITDADTLTFIGSYLFAKDDFYNDADGTPLPIYGWRRWGDFDQYSSELRLTHDADTSLTYQIGVFGQHAEGTLNQLTDLTVLTGAPGFSTYEFGGTTSTSYSAFGEGDFKMLDNKLVFTAGARYITETKKLVREGQILATGQYTVGPHAGGERTDNKVIYRLGARYHFNDDIMAYVTNSTGFRSGGLSPRAQDPDVLARGYAPEKLTNWEAGLRTKLFDQRLIFNVTAFHMIYDNMQIELTFPSALTGTQLAVDNAGKAKFDGFEVEMEAAATAWWRLSGNFGYLKAKYKDLTVDLYGDQIIADETHLKLRRAPKITWDVTSNVELPIGNGTLNWRVGYSWRDTYQATITNYPGSAVKSFGLLDSSISYSWENWKFSVFGRNLTDEDAWTHVYVVNPLRPRPNANFPNVNDPAPGTLWRFANVRQPREVGVEVLYKF